MLESTKPLKYCYYDPQERVIFNDFSGLTLSSDLLDKVTAEIILIAQSLPVKVYMITCWKDVTLKEDFNEAYRRHLPELLKYVKGALRYDVNTLMATVTIRSETVTQHLQNTRSFIFPNREAALAEVRRLEAETAV